jgi:hypothetical protein
MGQSEALAGLVAELARVPLALTVFDARRPIGRDELAELSAGMLAPTTREGREQRLKRETRAPPAGEHMPPSLSPNPPVVPFLL